MNRDEANEYAKDMTYMDALANLKAAKCVPYKKATLAKVQELVDLLESKEGGVVGVLEQIRWERDVAISQLAELGYGFGEKAKDGDTISRKAVEMALTGNITGMTIEEYISMVSERIRNIGSTEKTGHWIVNKELNGRIYCSECGMYSGLTENDLKEGWKLGKFCSECGCRMLEPQKSEEKE